jgi:hypothetical protein
MGANKEGVMPKEYVDDAWDFAEAVDMEGNPVEKPPMFRVKVGWNREAGDVQIATVNESEDVDQFSVESGLHVNLDRRGINKLIRHLRHARDQAFGRDE